MNATEELQMIDTYDKIDAVLERASEGMSEEEAKKMVAEAEKAQHEPGLFDDKE